VKAGRLLPVDTGGKLRSYNIARALARRHDVTMLTYYEGRLDPSYEAEMRAEFPGALSVRCGPKRMGPVVEALRYAYRIASPVPYAVSKFAFAEVRGAIDAGTARGDYDALICDFLSASRNFRRVDGIPTVLFQHNVESQLWVRQAQHAPDPIRRFIYALEAWKMKRYEAATVERFRHVIAVSEEDRRLMRNMVPDAQIAVVPTGVDVARFASVATTEAMDSTVLFLGSMDWEPNADGVQWMCAQIWPRILAAVPNASFRIVGRNPPASVRGLAGHRVIVTGSVPTVEPHLADTSVFVVPLRIGGGTRLKIFEAMAAGRAVVSTRIGAEGLAVTHGKDILLEDEPDAFAAAVVRLLTDADRRREIARNGLALARAHSWSAMVSHFEAAVLRAGAVKQPGVVHGER
jgi:glycosyltransferase involved in cell wall biosynthesis